MHKVVLLQFVQGWIWFILIGEERKKLDFLLEYWNIAIENDHVMQAYEENSRVEILYPIFIF
jgi:hypothetical protein